jgi:hypothetical protein
MVETYPVRPQKSNLDCQWAAFVAGLFVARSGEVVFSGDLLQAVTRFRAMTPIVTNNKIRFMPKTSPGYLVGST